MFKYWPVKTKKCFENRNFNWKMYAAAREWILATVLPFCHLYYLNIALLEKPFGLVAEKHIFELRHSDAFEYKF